MKRATPAELAEDPTLSEETLLAEVGQRLRRLRLTADLTQDELAERSGLARKTIQNAETGKNCSLEKILRMLRAIDRIDLLQTFLRDPHLAPEPLHVKGKERQRAMRPRQRRGENDLEELTSGVHKSEPRANLPDAPTEKAPKPATPVAPKERRKSPRPGSLAEVLASLKPERPRTHRPPRVPLPEAPPSEGMSSDGPRSSDWN
jgi:transcriptional regulator with XRE-family HTH domain